jgi:hypothetical protein
MWSITRWITAAPTAAAVRGTNPPKILVTVAVVPGRSDSWRSPRKLRRKPSGLGLAVAKAFVPTVLSNFRTPAHRQTTSRPNWGEALEQDQDGTAVVPSWSCSKAVYKPVWHIPLLSAQQLNSWWWTEELSETCRVSCQNKFVKSVHLVGFIIKKFGQYVFWVRTGNVSFRRHWNPCWREDSCCYRNAFSFLYSVDRASWGNCGFSTNLTHFFFTFFKVFIFPPHMFQATSAHHQEGTTVSTHPLV